MDRRKGVICKVRPRAEMPVTEDGRQVDIIVYAKGAAARLNPGQFFEHYINATGYYIHKDMVEMIDGGKIDKAWNHFMNFLEIVAPDMHRNALTLTPTERSQTIEKIYDHGIYLTIPAGSPHMTIENMMRMRAYRAPLKTRLTYTNLVGRVETTRVPVLVGAMQYMVLDKLDHKPMAISGVLRQHHGLPAAQNKSTKYLRPTKENPPRVGGENEVRSFVSIMGGDAAAEYRNVSANPEAHRIAVRRIYMAENPAAVPSVYDRPEPGMPAQHPARSLQVVRHIDECAGRAVRAVPVGAGWDKEIVLSTGETLRLRPKDDIDADKYGEF